MKETAISHIHNALGAKMVDFAGFLMPVTYKGINEEHLKVRSDVGIFDVSHMGEFYITGKQAADLVQYVTSNDVTKLTDGKIQYSCLPNEMGGIIDDLLVYRISEEEYLLVVNASNIEKDKAWILKNNKFDAKLTDRSDGMSLFAVQGPKTSEALQSLTETNLSEMKYYTFEHDTFAGVEDVLISATGYTGAGGFEIYMPNDKAEIIWKAIMAAGESCGIEPIGLAARDTLRLEMGFCLYGNDIDDTTSPLEAGLGWITKFNGEFINSRNLAYQKEKGVGRKLVGFELLDRGIPRKDYVLLSDTNEEIGVVTSGTMSPCLEKGIGLGYVRPEFAKTGTEIGVQVRNRTLKAKVVKLPFYKADK
ncbi:MAG: aminomethyltransferase [Patiriisocius sp.]|jgi:aminomethyltransferase